MEILKKIYDLLRVASRPVVTQFAFFVGFWALITCSTFGYLFAYLDSWPSIKCALKYLCIGTMVAYGATLLVAVSKRGAMRAAVKTLFYTVAMVLLSAYAFLWQNFEMKISPHVLTLIAETNSSETSEFFDAYLLNEHSYIAYATIAGVLVLLVLLEWRSRVINAQVLRRHWFRRVMLGVVAIMLIVAAAKSYMFVTLAACGNSADMDRWEEKHEPWPADLITATVYSYNSLRAARGDVALAVRQARAVFDTPVSVTESDTLDVIYVLGESYIKWHTPLYGYDHNTTPRLLEEQRRGNLYVFTDVISPYNATSVAEKNTFSCNSMMDGENWFEKPMFPTVFRHAGFNVYFWDMQRSYQKHKMYTMTVNAFVYNPEIARLSYSDTVAKKIYFDATLIDNFRDSARVARGKYNLVMFHLLGQHVNAKDRFPDLAKFHRFTKDSVTITGKWLTDKSRQYIADYDNATYYNDVVMSRIFKMYRNRNAVVVYYSDHGDEAYDYRDQKGRFGHDNPDSLHLKYQNDIPFMIWCSDRYKQLHPEVVKNLEASLNRPFMIDNACQVLFHVAGIKTPYYRPERDLLSPSFKPVKRKVYYKYDYDSRRWPKHKSNGDKKRK
ncbi:MAG: phosphoethanolamine transferase [Muribaculaceae bacterium]|nr:phosphoethanolamine transferase [Muribaculaceae bacterium]